MNKIVVAMLAAAAMASAGMAQANADLAKSKNCLGCHTVDKKLVGPAFRDVAAKYAGVKGAEAKLVASVTKGSSGAWGPMAMPANAVSEAEAQSLVKWVLAQK